jgi:ferritin-like metal-binding protein YciE
VRYSQLKKVQDVLVHDLEHCVSRRDAIMTTAEARERRMKNGMEKTRINFTRKLDDTRNKIKQMENVVLIVG